MQRYGFLAQTSGCELIVHSVFYKFIMQYSVEYNANVYLRCPAQIKASFCFCMFAMFASETMLNICLLCIVLTIGFRTRVLLFAVPWN